MDKSNVYLCRCENLTLEALHKMLDDGSFSMEEIKRSTRCTMGPCQGRTCRELIAKEIAKYHALKIEDIDMPTYRAPIKPIKMGKVAGGAKNA